MKNTLFLFFFTLICFSACKENTEQQGINYEATQNETYANAAVVAAHPLASDIGKAILKKGGNAVDAAVAVQFALAVVSPRAGNIGGGGFMVYRQADGQTSSLDYREKAPAAAHHDMYLDSLKNVIPDLSVKGHLAAGVPGTVAGLAAAHQKYGKLAWADLINPAIELAKNGFQVSETEVTRRLIESQDDFKAFNENTPFIKDDWKAGDLLIQTELATTLERIRDQGQDGFYKGKTADLIVAEMQQGNGLITHEDLTNYEAVWRTPITGQYKNYKIISMPPPSSGGIALVQMLNMIEPYPIAEYGFQSTAATHLMVEAERRAYADRAEFLGDSDHYTVPIDSLLDETYLQNRMNNFNPDSTTLSAATEAGLFENLKESFETTHTSIVDADGNAVSLTTTLNSNFGSKVIVDGAGFFLNNEMDDFSAKPGVPNIYGLVGAEANAIQPGKRMLSSMTPTIIEKDGELFMLLGTPGGSTIITTVFQVFVNVAEFGMTLDEAVKAPRFHHQWLPDHIKIEPTTLSESVRAELTAMGHQFDHVKRIAVLKAIQVLPDGTLQGVGDFRNPDDDVSGY